MYKARLSYEQNLQRWITKYERIDNREDMTFYFGNLSIDTHNDCTLELESFYTKLEQFYTSFG